MSNTHPLFEIKDSQGFYILDMLPGQEFEWCVARTTTCAKDHPFNSSRKHGLSQTDETRKNDIARSMQWFNVHVLDSLRFDY